MKRIFVLLASIVAFVGCNTNKCEIIGAIDNFDGMGYVYLTDMWDNRAVIDSVKLDINRFHFKNVKHTPTFAQLEQIAFSMPEQLSEPMALVLHLMPKEVLIRFHNSEMLLLRIMSRLEQTPALIVLKPTQQLFAKVLSWIILFKLAIMLSLARTLFRRRRQVLPEHRRLEQTVFLQDKSVSPTIQLLVIA